MYNDVPVIPPSLRELLLQHLHSSHLGRDKMKSLARLICLWPSVNSDITNFAINCEKCKKKPRTHPTWKPWPITYSPMQRIHANFCGPFIGKFYALVVQDSFSKFPEVFLTTSASSDFTKMALRRFLHAREYRKSL